MLWPSQLYTVAQCRELDSRAIASGIDGYTLMCRAGQTALQVLLRQWGMPQHIHILCGTGNNGGDGLVVARLAKARNLTVSVYLLGNRSKIKGEAARALEDAEAAGVTIQAFDKNFALVDGVVVDALFGIGLNRPLDETAKAAVEWVNQARLPVLALDIPSGLCGDTGQILGDAIYADKTVSFIGAKRGLFTADGVSVSGMVLLDDLDVPSEIISQVGQSIAHRTFHELLTYLPARSRNAHKGKFGHVLIVGGNTGMGGAAIIAAEAAARSGAGLVSLATRPEHVNAMLARQPEVMAHGVVSGQELDPLLESPDVIVIGPGLGQTPWSEQMLQKVLATNKPVVIDADALNLLSNARLMPKTLRDNWVLTPHPGEAARLLAITNNEINQDRFAAVERLQKQLGGTVVLKGAGSLIRTQTQTSLCSYGNPGMSSGGMGDLLSGIIGGLLAQKLPAYHAVPLAVALHAKAADLAAAEFGEHGLQATDLITPLRYLLNGKH